MPRDAERKDAEALRLNQAGPQWKKWGPYLSERQWGTVREDYSENGNAWDYFTHDHSRSRAYRWGEDGIAGISDDHQVLCFALALWNGRDPILKERLFGLTNSEGNHGEDVKEYYYYLDSTPTHSYMKHLYKYPQRAYPYSDLVETNRRRSRQEPEYELLDTGIFEEGRYFDVFTRVREMRAGRPVDSHRGGEPRAGSGRTVCAAHAVLSEYVVVARRGLEARVETAGACGWRERDLGATHGPAVPGVAVRPLLAVLRRRSRDPVHGERK